MRATKGTVEKLEPFTVTIHTTQQITGLSHTSVYALIGAGDLETVKVGKRRLVVYASIKRLLRPDTELRRKLSRSIAIRPVADGPQQPGCAPKCRRERPRKVEPIAEPQ